MPFTPSHAIVALPFLRTPLVPAAVAVGAMAPDLPLFVRGAGLDYGVTHDLRWILLTALVALALLIVWRAVLRPATRELSPGWLASRLPDEWDASAPGALRETFAARGRTNATSLGALAVGASLMIGVASHIVWDLFTHEGRWGSEVFPALDERWGPFTGYTWLQHGSSAVGAVGLAVWAVGWLRGRDGAASPTRIMPEWIRRVWWLSLPAVLAGAWTWGLCGYGPLTADWTPAHLAYRVLPPACAIWGAATILLCLAVQLRRRRRAV